MDLIVGLILSLFVSLLSQLAYCDHNVTEEDQYKLELVSMVFRHGDRSPVESFPESEYPLSYWPQGFSQLSLTGMRQAYYLGEILRERYVDSEFLSRNYTREEVYVRSSDTDRTLMTVQCVLANLFPPGPDQMFTQNLAWQPIPVHTVPGEDDRLLRAYEVHCPNYQALLVADQESDEYKELERTNQDFFEMLGNYTGVEVNLTSVLILSDTLFVEYISGLTHVYDWFNESIIENTTPLFAFGFNNLFINNDIKTKVVGGLWASQVLNDMHSKSVNKENDPLKLILYSAHDLTVGAMLNVFSMYDEIRPPYTSAYIIELYSKNDNYFVRFYYRNETDSHNLTELFHPNCSSSPCELGELMRIMNDSAITDAEWEAICGITMDETPTNGTTTNGTITECDDDSTSDSDSTVIGLSVVVAILAILVIILVIVVVPLAICQCKGTSHEKV